MKKITTIILVLTFVLSLISFEMPALGAEKFFGEDFENYTGALYIGQEESGNHYVKLNSSESGKNAYYKDSKVYPDSDFIVSLDFMVPTGGTEKAQLLCVAWYNGKANGMHIWLDGTDIKIGDNANPNDGLKIATNIKKDKWYSIFAYIKNTQFSFDPMPEAKEDCPEGPFYDFYLCESTLDNPDGIYKPGRTFGNTWRGLYDRINNAGTDADKETIKGYSYLGRYVLSRDYSNKDLYIDNVLVETVTNEAFDVELYKARSFAGCANAGYDNGEYPQGAVDKLTDIYNECKNTVITDENVEENTLKLSNAIAEFKSRIIDENDSSQATNHIKINESGIMSPTGGVQLEGGYTATLDAKAYTKADQIIDNADITWSVFPENDKVEIRGNTLTVEPGFEGKITLKAQAEDVYAKYEMELVAIRNVTVDKFEGKNGKIVLEGTLSGNISSTVGVRISGDDGDALTEDISLSDDVSLDENNSFKFETTVDESTSYQKITATIEGGGIATKETTAYYYGQGWEEGVRAEINVATQEQTATVLKSHAGVLYVDTTLVNNYTEVYSARVKKNTYSTLKEIENVVIDTEYVLKQSGITRNGIEELLEKNSVLLKNNGFDIEELGKLESTNIPVFYTNAAIVSVDTLNDSVKDICDELKIIFNSLAKQDEDEENNNEDNTVTIPPASTGGFSGGGSGGGSYPVSLVGGKKEETEQNKDVEDIIQNDTPPFGDVSKNDWSYDAFKFLKEKNIMVGDGTNVRPADNVTRGEFAKIIVTAFELKGSGTSKFTDGSGMWWNEYASIAAECGIVNGMGDGNFGGNAVINREMLAVMIARAIKAKGIELYDQNEGITFNDNAYASDYAKEDIAFLTRKGIVSGIGGNLFAPSLPVTREQAAQIVYNVLKQL